MKKSKLFFVIPAYNEEETIGNTLDDVKKSFPNAGIVVVNDSSEDKTEEIVKKKKIRILTHVINRGLGATLATGITFALKNDADIIVTFDADLQHTASSVKKLISPIENGEADVVIGSRFLKKEHLEMMPLVKKIGNTALTGITNILSGTKITDSQSGLRAFNREAAENLLILCDKYEVSSEIIYELGRKNMRIKEIPIKAIYDKRSATKGTNIRSGLHIFWSMLLRHLGVKK